MIYAICNQKGGVAKTTTALNLGNGLANRDKRVLLVDADPQADLTKCLGIETSKIESSLADLIKIQATKSIDEVIINISKNLDAIASNYELSAIDIALATRGNNRENILKEQLKSFEKKYDYVIVDCMPSLGMLTINALTAADKVIIPTELSYLSVKGLQNLLRTIVMIRKKHNPQLSIMGILITMVDIRTLHARKVYRLLHEHYGNKVRIFKTRIPRSIKVMESSLKGVGISEYAPDSKAAKAYEEFVEEVLEYAK